MHPFRSRYLDPQWKVRGQRGKKGGKVDLAVSRQKPFFSCRTEEGGLIICGKDGRIARIGETRPDPITSRSQPMSLPIPLAHRFVGKAGNVKRCMSDMPCGDDLPRHLSVLSGTGLFVRHGLGVAMTDEFSVAEVDMPGLIRRPLKETRRVEIFVPRKKGRALSGFAEFAIAQFRRELSKAIEVGPAIARRSQALIPQNNTG